MTNPATATFSGTVFTQEMMLNHTGPELVKLYNEVARVNGQAPIKRFADMKSALRRTWDILIQYCADPVTVIEETPEVLGEVIPLLTSEEKAQALFDAIPDRFKLTAMLQPVKVAIAVDATPTPIDAIDAIALETKAVVVEKLMKLASAGQQRNAAQAALRASPPASDNPDKDAEMPALRRALKPMNLAPKKTVYPRLAGSKQARLIDLLSRPEGVTFGELYDAMAATGKPWRAATIRSGLAWDINYLAGYGVKSELFSGTQFAEQGRDYEARRLGVTVANGVTRVHEGYDPELRLAVYHLTYPKDMDAPLPHNPRKG